MAKKGFFSWFRKDKSKDEVKAPEAEVTTPVATEASDNQQDQDALARNEAERLEAERLEVEKAEAARLEAEHLEAEKVETARLEAQRVESERLEAQRAESERLEAQRVETERLEAQRVETERLEAQRVESERLEAQRVETERLEAQRVETERLEAQRVETERLEAQRVETERLEAQRVETERLEAQRVETERLEAQSEAQRVEAERLEAQRVEAERLEAEKAAEAARIEAERLEAESAAEALAAETAEVDVELQPEPQVKPVKEGFFARLKRGLKRTSENIGSGFVGLFKGKKIDDDLFEELEEQLLIADVGVETTTRLIDSLTEQASRKQLKDGEALYELLREEMQKTLEPVSIPLVPENADGPFVILMVGVNGVGKTTTIGKLAKQYQAQGKSVMLAAGDTFRAAAVEQLQVWGQRNDIPVIAQHTGADSASVLFDALQAARARNVDVLIADTAGRLQNKAHLMDELKKVVRVMKKLDENAPHEVMLTLDAGTGQNAISQADLFKKAVGVTGITISKLDGTAKGGVIFAIADKFGIPIRHIGVGEQIDDLRTFNAKDFVDALFTQESDENK
ncbi:signal recognition particle-docking protein FtsY [Shewanella eurypsychrophilus]|uniref:Signal recognition particle receptor FtsY n=1 Tax=Shewanella eurypsychrophilus TaxID=2593656 RepID=A0ABX6V3S3_9GAMM|nr:MULTISPECIES: signal recognition particle-docking protein FtsY [Shewanella]QFU20629.1 signal recognition particle-docking protein FtsY [Shewanella sp. YLB-09]QPG56197.1 signal recognition particle-docking protein FtsY [Shewanella eurypsychrophilus]